MCKKYMVLCVAGQSNAVGYDESAIERDYLSAFRTARIRQLGFYGEDNLHLIPLGACAQSYQDLRPYGHPQNPGMGTRGIHLPLCDRLLDLIPPDYDLLVISCAYGGTGFTVHELGPYDAQTLRPAPGFWRWGVRSNYYLAMKARIAYALDLCPENQFLGVVWCQGEHDSGDAAGQIRGFEVMTADFFSSFAASHPGRVYRGDWNRSIWYTYETTYYWYTQGQCAAIWTHYKHFSPETYVAIPRDTPTNEIHGTGLTTSIRAAHFGNNAFARIIAPRVAAVFARRLSD